MLRRQNIRKICWLHAVVHGEVSDRAIEHRHEHGISSVEQKQKTTAGLGVCMRLNQNNAQRTAHMCPHSAPLRLFVCRLNCRRARSQPFRGGHQPNDALKAFECVTQSKPSKHTVQHMRADGREPDSSERRAEQREWRRSLRKINRRQLCTHMENMCALIDPMARGITALCVYQTKRVGSSEEGKR